MSENLLSASRLLPYLLIAGLLAYWRYSHRRIRRELEAATRDRDLLRTLIDSLPDFIYIKDRECRFTIANQFCCDAMGASRDRLLGRTDFDFYPAHIARNFFEDERKVIESGKTLLCRQEEVVDCRGRAFTILTTKVPLREQSGAVVGIIGIGRNISDLVAVEKQLRAAQASVEAEMRERERISMELRLAQKLESIGRLASGIAHEINTPIQYVSDSVHFMRAASEGLSALLAAYRDAVLRYARTDADSTTLSSLAELEARSDYEYLRVEMPRALQRCMEGVKRVAAIVRAMREFAHPDSNEQKAADINHSLSTTLTVAHGEYKHAARAEVELGAIPDIVCTVGELNQVFLNLIVNAAHAIADAGRDADSGVISVKTQLAGDRVQITIADNGCGIPPADLERIFDPFFTTKDVGRGTGQGLAIARSIVVDRHQGEINVTSEVGVGTRFDIRLPIDGRSKRAARSSPHAAVGGG